MWTRVGGERVRTSCLFSELTLPYGSFACRKREEGTCLGIRNLKSKVARTVASLKQSTGTVNLGGVTGIISLYLNV